MGLFDSLFGSKPKTSKMKVAGLAASCLDYVINDAGVGVLIAGSLVLDKTLNVSFLGGKPKTGGDILAGVTLGDLSEADVFKELVKSGLSDTSMLDTSMMAPFIDQLVYAAIRRFEAQSPEFAALPTA